MKITVNQAQVDTLLAIPGSWGTTVYYTLDPTGANVVKFAASSAPYSAGNWYEIGPGIVSIADFTTAMGGGATLYQVSDIDS
jgi:hypothetical protein